MNELALFAGAGGGILGGHLLGWRTVCAVEWDAYAASVLVARQNDGTLLPFPIWDDVQTFDGRPWRGRVDVVSGGFPCQDISAAGKGAGISGERSGTWGHMARIIGEVRPGCALVENSPELTHRGLGTVLGDLAEMGYNAKWGVLGAGRLGGCHNRERIWVLALDSDLHKYEGGYPQQEIQRRAITSAVTTSERCWWKTVPEVGRVADGVANRMDRARAIGNGQVPAVAATAFKLLSDRMK
jgi:DNA (cytosine-5)-methyltransferase 1